MSDFDTVHDLYESQTPEAMDEEVLRRTEAPPGATETIRRFLSWAHAELSEQSTRITSSELVSKFVEYGKGLGYGDPRFALLTEKGDVAKPVAEALAKIRRGEVHAAMAPFPPPGELRTVAEPVKKPASKKGKKKGS